ncbi:nickel/cobalt transporter [Yoonia sp. 208BN28-4]|uniref:nickel/cobalt transporter n=1 Tax=Yoonia sp. 208BN28-4 TaxID=3126505 RepID=UPI0030A90FA2
MRGIAAIILAVLVAGAIWLWGFGGADHISRWSAATQRDVQNAMAGSLRALRAGDTSALVGLWGLCLAYGFVHAAGPGHGKLVIGGYGTGVRVTAQRLAGLAAVSSLAQAVVAIVIVTVALTVLGWGREALTAFADRTMAPVSYALIAGVGLWLFLRGLRKGWQMRAVPHTHDHDRDHDDHDPATCASCGHAHAPTPDQAAAVKTWRDALAVVAAIAIRPCTGAIFLLILTYALGLYWAGVIGVLVMGLGTAAFTALTALAAVSARESALAQAASARGTAILLVSVEVLAGAVILVLAIQLFLRVA